VQCSANNSLASAFFRPQITLTAARWGQLTQHVPSSIVVQRHCLANRNTVAATVRAAYHCDSGDASLGLGNKQRAETTDLPW
jgi:hypothetical protein